MNLEIYVLFFVEHTCRKVNYIRLKSKSIQLFSICLTDGLYSINRIYLIVIMTIIIIYLCHCLKKKESLSNETARILQYSFTCVEKDI